MATLRLKMFVNSGFARVVRDFGSTFFAHNIGNSQILEDGDDFIIRGMAVFLSVCIPIYLRFGIYLQRKR